MNSPRVFGTSDGVGIPELGEEDQTTGSIEAAGILNLGRVLTAEFTVSRARLGSSKRTSSDELRGGEQSAGEGGGRWSS